MRFSRNLKFWKKIDVLRKLKFLISLKFWRILKNFEEIWSFEEIFEVSIWSNLKFWRNFEEIWSFEEIWVSEENNLKFWIIYCQKLSHWSACNKSFSQNVDLGAWFLKSRGERSEKVTCMLWLRGPRQEMSRYHH